MINDYVVKDELVGLMPPIKGSQRQAISLEIEDIFKKCPEMTYVDACLFFLEQYDYDFSKIPNLINQTLKSKIETEALKNKTLIGSKTTKSSLARFV